LVGSGLDGVASADAGGEPAGADAGGLPLAGGAPLGNGGVPLLTNNVT
jgi:hypothetical protein